MGQAQSHYIDNRKLGISLRIDAKAIRIYNYIEAGSLGESCLQCCTSTTNPLKLHNKKWRREAIQQLKALDLANWPQSLIRMMKKSDREEYDVPYQMELFWVDTNYSGIGSKPFGVKLDIGANVGTFFDDTLTHDDSYEKMSLQVQSAFELNQNMKQIIDASDIFEERLPVHKQNLAKSWNGRSLDTLDSVEKSNNNPRPIGLSKGNTESQDIRPSKPKGRTKRTRHTTTEKYKEEYSNRMLTSQVPLVNGMDGRNIDNLEDLYQAVKKYKTVTNLIARHLEQKEHIFNKFLNEFKMYFTNQYANIMNLYKQGKISLQNCESERAKATKDLQQFILFFYETLDQFYCLRNLRLGRQANQEMLFNRNNMINFVTALVFRPDIHNTIFSLYLIQENDKEKLYRRNLRHCATFKPEDYGVSDAYCLNERTVRFLNKFSTVDRNSTFVENFSEEENILESQQDEVTVNTHRKGRSIIYRKSMKQSTRSSLGRLENVIETEENIPYEKAIKLLQILPKKNSPIQKLKIIVKTAELINEEIDEFYQKYGADNQDKLSGDDTFSIFMYIVGKSRIHNLKTHCKIIEKFSTSNILSSISGYYAITLEACVNYLCEMNLPDNFTGEQFGSSFKEYINSLGKSGIVEESMMQEASRM